VPTLSVDASAIDFGNVNLNSPSTQSLTLTSTGSISVTVSSATVSGAGFSVSGASFPLTLAPNQSAALSVQFDPTAAGAASGMLSLTSNSSTTASTAISLIGTGGSSAYQVNLTWNAPDNSSDPVAGYNVYRAPNGSTSYELLNSSMVTQTTYSDSTVTDNQTYSYYVESVDASGNSSPPSSTSSINVP
jgi:Abnormal spindle-like microcephaly-assoc'd, ASPM-SPD-2-Hydin